MAGIEHLGDILARNLSSLGILPKARRYQVFQVWRKVVGPISRNARPRRLDGDVLFVATSSSAWAQELTLMSQTIIQKLNRALGGEFIREIRFSERLWSMVADEDQPLPAGSSAVSQKPGVPETEEIQTLLAEIRDPRLSHAFGSFYRTVTRKKNAVMQMGHTICRVCGTAYGPKQERCPLCKILEDSRATRRAVLVLDKNPELSTERVMEVLRCTQREPVERARRILESRWISFIRLSLAQAGRDEAPSEVVACIRKLAALRTGTPADRLDESGLEQAVGSRLARIAAGAAKEASVS